MAAPMHRPAALLLVGELLERVGGDMGMAVMLPPQALLLRQLPKTVGCKLVDHQERRAQFVERQLEPAEKVLFECLTELGEHHFDLSGPELDLRIAVVGGLFLAIDVGVIGRSVFAGAVLARSGEVHVELGRRGSRGVRVENAAKRLDEVAPARPVLAHDQGVLPRPQLQVPPASKRRDPQMPNAHTAC